MREEGGGREEWVCHLREVLKAIGELAEIELVEVVLPECLGTHAALIGLAEGLRGSAMSC
jgi:hypothetical protein